MLFLLQSGFFMILFQNHNRRMQETFNIILHVGVSVLQCECMLMAVRAGRAIAQGEKSFWENCTSLSICGVFLVFILSVCFNVIYRGSFQQCGNVLPVNKWYVFQVLENFSDAPMTPKQILHVIQTKGLKEMRSDNTLPYTTLFCRCFRNCTAMMKTSLGHFQNNRGHIYYVARLYLIVVESQIDVSDLAILSFAVKNSI